MQHPFFDTRLTNWVIYARAGDPSQPPPRREDWSRRGKLAEVLKYARRLKLPQLDVEAMIRAGVPPAMTIIVTHTSACTAALVWMTIEWCVLGKPSALGIARA